jgi:hypothetical protein
MTASFMHELYTNFFVSYEKIRMVDNISVKLPYVWVVAIVCSVGCGGGGSGSVALPSSAQVQQAAVRQGTSFQNLADAIDPMSVLSTTQSVSISPPVRGATPISTVGTTSTVTNEFGSGTVGSDGVTRSGSIAVTWNTSSNTGSVQFNNYAVNGQPVTGSITLSNIALGVGSFSATEAIDLTLTSGHYVANVTENYANSVTTLNGTYAFTPTSGPSYSGAIVNVQLDPSQYGNDIPFAGDVTSSTSFTTTSGQTLDAVVTISFNTSTPTTKQVGVSVRGVAEPPITLP